MTENRRIALNIAATYGRSLFALVCGLFTSRWVLMALGQSDYGLYGVVGGLTAFIAFFNGLMAAAVGRFYAFSVGQAKVAGTQGEGLEVCRQWFNTAVLIHTAVPLVLIAVGYPVGMWAVESFLTIPPERVEACRWVFRFVCLSCFVAMVNVPFTDHKPLLACWESFDRYLMPRFRRWLGRAQVNTKVDVPHWGDSLALPSVKQNLEACAYLYSLPFKRRFLVIHRTQKEWRDGAVPLGEVPFVRQAEVYGVTVLFLRPDVGADYRDNIHLNLTGQRRLYDLLHMAVFNDRVME